MGRNGSGKSTLLWTLQGSRERRAGRVEVSGTDPATQAPALRRTLVGLVPQTAADLLYLETVAEECRGGRRRLGGGPQAPRPAGAGHPRRHPSARPVRGAAAGAGPGRGAASVPRRCCCSTSRPAGLDYPAKAELASCAPGARRRRPRGDGGDPRRGVRRRGRRPGRRARARARSSPTARPGRCWRPRRRSPRRSPRSSVPAGCASTRCRDDPAARRTARPPVRAGPRRRLRRRADDAGLAAAGPRARRAARSARRSCSSPCCRW